MARLSKADVSALQLVEDLQRLDLTNKRSVGEWILRHCAAAKRADPRILALLDGNIPVNWDKNKRKKSPAKSPVRRKGRR